jgi:tetratricopeptide (TPR) repeat protein/predicted Ser/Thr protein kinase
VLESEKSDTSSAWGPVLPVPALGRWHGAPAPRSGDKQAGSSEQTTQEPLVKAQGESAMPSPASESPPARPAGHQQIGRYVVLREIGSGAMGRVLLAYDPDLDRKVALKILRGDVHDDPESAARMRREAQAMARLSHPNVAQVYEVADEGGQLFLAMEYIAGTTLRDWLTAKPRPWREALLVYREAGRGLAAAHAAGLMHRDFKPDNAMIAADGRVRVLDFGLSRLHATSETTPDSSSSAALAVQMTAANSLVGTPAYMSPEQFERQEADARSDQFSFCVALWEALYGQRPFAGETIMELGANVRSGVMLGPPVGPRVPTWVRRVLERGLALAPESRWPTMEALLAALSQDPARLRWRWLAAATGVAAIAGASYSAALYGTTDAQRCTGAADELIGAWGAEQRGAIEQALRSTGASYADQSLAATVTHLDAYAAKWTALHTEACTSHRRGHTSPQLFDRRMACLRQRRSELAATTAVLAQTTRETLAQAVDTASGLPAVALCADDERLLAAVTPPDDPAVAAAVEASRGQLARLQALERGGRYSEAMIDTPGLVAEAERLGYLPHLAEVHLLAGKLFMNTLQADARGHFEKALEAGLEAKLDTLAAEALALQVFQIGYVERRPSEAQVLAPLGWGLLRRSGNPPRETALMYNNMGPIHRQLGQRAAASRSYEASLALLNTHVPEDPLRWAVLNNLAGELVATGQHVRAADLVRTSLVPLAAQYGQCHPVTALLRIVLGDSEEALGHPQEAIQTYEEAIACLIEGTPGYALLVIADLASLYLRRGDMTQARRQITRAEELLRRSPELRPQSLDTDIVRADLDRGEGRLAAARQSYGELRLRAVDNENLMRIDTRLGLTAHLQHDDEEALRHLQRVDESQRAVLSPGEQGLYLFTLARVLRALGREPERAATLAEEAITAYSTAGAQYVGKVAEIRAWRTAERVDPSRVDPG